ncbi:MAG: TrmH family RNA methyltransferase [Flavobacterium sp.]
MNYKKITAIQNPLVKEITLLSDKAKIRKQNNQFIIEGKRELSLAIEGNYLLDKILFCKDYISESEITPYTNQNVEIIEISKDIYQKIAYRDTTEGIIAVARCKNHLVNLLKLKSNNIILIAESIEKPGNIGALLRTADAAKIDAFILTNPKTDLYNPNVVRSSVGGLFTNSIAMGSNQEVYDFLIDNKFKIFATTLQNSNIYYQENFQGNIAIIVGTEATGLSDFWKNKANQNINIPMEGKLDSMNVSVAAAIVLFEAKRQRV